MRAEGCIFAGGGTADPGGTMRLDDVEAATAEPAAKGIEPDGELKSGYGLRYRHFRAPDGRRFELLDRRV